MLTTQKLKSRFECPLVWPFSIPVLGLLPANPWVGRPRNKVWNATFYVFYSSPAIKRHPHQTIYKKWVVDQSPKHTTRRKNTRQETQKTPPRKRVQSTLGGSVGRRRAQTICLNQNAPVSKNFNRSNPPSLLDLTRLGLTQGQKSRRPKPGAQVRNAAAQPHTKRPQMSLSKTKNL